MAGFAVGVMGSVEAVMGLGLLVLVADLAGRRSAWVGSGACRGVWRTAPTGFSVPLLMTTSV